MSQRIMNRAPSYSSLPLEERKAVAHSSVLPPLVAPQPSVLGGRSTADMLLILDEPAAETPREPLPILDVTGMDADTPLDHFVELGNGLTGHDAQQDEADDAAPPVLEALSATAQVREESANQVDSFGLASNYDLGGGVDSADAPFRTDVRHVDTTGVAPHNNQIGVLPPAPQHPGHGSGGRGVEVDFVYPPTLSIDDGNLHLLVQQLNNDGDRWGEPGEAVNLRIAFPFTYWDIPADMRAADDLLNEDGENDPVYALLEKGLRVFTEDMIDDTIQAMEMWTDHTNQLSFTVVEPGEEADIYFYGLSFEDFGGLHTPMNITRPDGSIERVSRIALDTDGGFPNTQPGMGGFTTLMHEFGHALGLTHPGDYNAGGDDPITYLGEAEYIEDTEQYTLMSYFSEEWTGADYFGWAEQSIRSHDIYVIQEMYGVNWELRPGDTTYGYNASPGLPALFDFSELSPTGQTNQPWGPIVTIFDGGGNDTLDLRYDGTDLVLDLRPGEFSSTHGMTHNISVAHAPGDVPNETRHLIENAVGGSGDDLIIGNDADNVLTGNLGNDTLMGGDGRDLYSGGVGTDLLDFSDESQGFTVHLSSMADNQAIIEGRAVSNDGHEIVRNIEDVALGSANDILTGSSRGNRLSGGGGNDVIRGLAGDD
ncbi:MAG: M10 family metallopeptidase C-terminal domain-containing protein, partial [Pseudomonadota bacterium]